MQRTAAALAFGALILVCISARAADDALCDRYAEEAVSAAAQDAARRCGYSGPAWNTDPVRHYTGHLNWCLASRNETVEREAASRRDAIYRCSICTTYARKAIDDIQKQDKLFCGNPSGPRWDPSHDSHLKWCLAAGFEDVDTGNYTSRQAYDLEYVTRDAFVGRCEACDRYSREAIRQQQESVANKCGFRGPRWNAHPGSHKSWCIENGFAQIGPELSSQLAKDIEQRERDQDLSDCKQCREYARTAAAQSKTAKACFPLSGKQWSIHEDTHYRTCMAFDRATRGSDTTREADARSKKVGECKVGVVTRPKTLSGTAGTSRAGAAAPSGAARRAPAGVVAPGLLEGDRGFTPQGPAAAGTPLGTGTSSPRAPAADSLRLR